MSPSPSRPTYMGIFGLFGAETVSSDQLDRYDFHDFPSLTKFVSSVLGFLPWCSSNGVNFNPVCIVNRITCNTLFTLSVKLIPSSKFVIIKFFNICIALSTTPFPVFTRGCNMQFQYFGSCKILGIPSKQTLLLYRI